MVSPVGSSPTLAKDNKNGFLSSILAWTRDPEDTIGVRQFPGFVVYNATTDSDILESLPQICRTALTEVIKCHPYTIVFQQLKYRGSLGSTNLTKSVCDEGCGTSLKSWFDTVTVACDGYQLGLSVPNRLGGVIWAGWNETCLTDPSNGLYCGDIMDSFSDAESLEDTPRTELCSWCNVHRLALMQSSAYSTYDDEWKTDLEYIYETCGISGNTTVPTPLVSLPAEPAPFCSSGRTYTVVQDDTCDKIAQAHNVSSASLYMGNELLYDCSDITAGLELCLPFECGNTYSFGPNDNCTGLEESLGLGSGTIRRLNAWLELDCRNMQVASAVFGHTLCLGAEGGNYTATAPIPGPTLLPGSATGYTVLTIAPPENMTGVAEGTTLKCGRWSVSSNDTTCAQICIQDAIPFDLFLSVNPSLSATDCSSGLVPGYAYCSGPIYEWNATRTTSPGSFNDDFSDGSMDGWEVYGGTFDAATKALVAGSSSGGKALINTDTFTDFTFEADIVLPSANSGNAGLVFRASNPGSGADSYSGYYAGFGTDGNLSIGRANNAWKSLEVAKVTVTAGQIYHLKVRAEGDSISVYLDDMETPIIDLKDSTYSSGLNGVRVYQTGATFDNIEIIPIEPTPIFFDFSDGAMTGWKVYGGTYDASTGALVAGNSEGGKAVLEAIQLTNFTFEADVVVPSGSNSNGKTGLLFRMSNPTVGVNNYQGYWAGISNDGKVLIGRANNSWTQLAVKQETIEVGQVHHIMIQASGNQLAVYLDDLETPKITIQDGTYSSGMFGVRVYQTGATFDNIEITP